MVGKYVPISNFTTSAKTSGNEMQMQRTANMSSLGKIPSWTNVRSEIRPEIGPDSASAGDDHNMSIAILRDLPNSSCVDCDTQAFPPLPSSQNIPETAVGIESNQFKVPETSIDGVNSQSRLPSSVQGTRSFAQVADFSKGFSPMIQSLEHKPDVRPVFLGFKHMAKEGFKIPLIQVAAAVGDIVGQRNVDAIQPIRNGWQIYMTTEADRALLMSKGLEIVGKSIDLQALVQDLNFNQNVKIILKDLLLNEVTNDRVLLALKKMEYVDVQSEVRYSNIYVNSPWTHLQNGDHFAYVTEASIPWLADTILVDDFTARIVKPTIYSRCSYCQ